MNVGRKSLADYRSIVPKDLMTEIDELAERLKGRRVLHVNATAFGGGVAEILYTLVPLVSDIGLEAHWQILTAPQEFYNVTKSFHNGLQGHAVEFPREARALYEEVCRANAAELTRPYDFVVIHDPQPLAIRDFVPAARTAPRGGSGAATSTRPRPTAGCTTTCCPPSTATTRPSTPCADYVPAGPHRPGARDRADHRPARAQEHELSAEDATYIVRQFGIDVERPLLLQVSRFDPWKDPLGVVDAYRIVKAKHPDVQLALIGSMASDDPEGWDYLERVIAYVGGDPDVFILSNLDNVGSVEINAFQSHADVILQKSTREGFGLTVTEGLWKGRPVIGGDVGGIPLQIEDGVTGYLVELRRGVRRALPAGHGRPGEASRDGAAAARRRCAASSSRRACCATTCGSSPISRKVR